jgi:hypothetical protein
MPPGEEFNKAEELTNLSTTIGFNHKIDPMVEITDVVLKLCFRIKFVGKTMGSTTMTA